MSLKNVAAIFFLMMVFFLSSNLPAQVDHKDDSIERSQNKNDNDAYAAASQKRLQVLKSNEQELVIEINIAQPEVSSRSHDGQTYHIVKIAGFEQTGEPGKPQLPFAGLLFGIPIAAQPHLELLSSEFTLEHHYHIYPAPRRFIQQTLPGDNYLTDEQHVKQEFYIDQNSYSSDSFYPAEPVKISETGFMRDQQVGRLEISPVQYNPATKETRLYRRMKLKISFEKHDVESKAGQSIGHSSPAFEKILSQSLVNYPAAKTWQQKKAVISPALIENQRYDFLQTGNSYKILVEQEGIYVITKAALENAGLNLSGVDPRKINIYHQGQPIAIYIRGESDGVFSNDDYIEFYGMKVNSYYTNTDIYWLNVGDTNGKRMATKNGSITGSPPLLIRSKESVHFEQDKIYETSIPNGESEDHWFWNYIVAPNTSNYTADLSNVSSISANDCSLKIEFRGYSYNAISPDHHTIVSLNGRQLADNKWDGQIKFQTQANFSQSLLTNGVNTVSVKLPGDTGAGVDIVYTNWFEIDYWRDYVAKDDVLSFWGQGNGWHQFQLKNFSNLDCRLYDITDPYDVKNFSNLSQVLDGTTYTLKFQDDLHSSNRYIALRPDRRKQPVQIVKDSPSQLKTKTNQADYIIITHEDFAARLSLLSYQREKQGLKPMIVKISDVYDEFNSGIKTPKAIKDFLSYAYNNWNPPAPTYVLLVGDASYDYKDNLKTGNLDYVPTHLFASNAYHTETSTDNWFACVSGEDVLPDMLIGRLPVRMASEIEFIVDKIVNYEENPAQGNWNKTALFVADNADAGGDFENTSDYFIRNYVPADYLASKVYLKDFGSGTTANSAIINRINQGCLLTNYLGHGSMDTWAGEKMFVSADVEKLTNSNKFPLVVTMSCLNGFFHHALEPYSLAEEFLKAKFKGSIACLAPSGFGYTSADKVLGDGLFGALFQDYDQILGSAVVQSKLNLFAGGRAYHDHIQFYNLLGDPALPINLPPFTIDLSQNWNLVSFPRQAPDPSISAVLAPIAGKWLQIMAYIDGEWQAAEASSSPSFWTLSELKLGQGYWLQMNSAAQLPVSGMEKSTAIPLNKDWNLIGYPTIFEQDVEAALSSVDKNWRKLLAYSNGNWSGADHSLDQKYWTLNELKPGYGFWLEMARPDTLEISRMPAAGGQLLALYSDREKEALNLKQIGIEPKTNSAEPQTENPEERGGIPPQLPPLPAGFYGSILIDNQPAPVGVEVVAAINGVDYPTNFKVIKAGQYGYLMIKGNIPSTAGIEGGAPGDTVVFKVITLNQDTLVSRSMATWETGVIQQHDLSFMARPSHIATMAIELRINDKKFGSEILAGDPVPSPAIFSAKFSGGENGINEQTIKLFWNGQLINEHQYNYYPNNQGTPPGGTLIYTSEKLPDGNHQLRIEVMDQAMIPNVATAEFAFWIDSELRFDKVVNFPNPMQTDTKFTYNLINDNPVQVSIKIYTVAGRLIKVIDSASGEVGYNETFWDGRDDFGDEIANGVYFYKLIAREGREKAEVIEKLVVMK